MNDTANSTLELLNLDVAGEFFAIDITQVQEVRVLEAVRKMPDLPKDWLGVIDFRQIMVPVLDLRAVLAGEHTDITSKTIVVIIQIKVKGDMRVVGLVVDAVSEVISVPKSALRTSPRVSDADFNTVQGLFRHESHIVVILDTVALIESGDFEGLREQLMDTSNVDL
ncbi:chemotaxis protein CheW [Alteromonas sp. ASW11-36]|uniref:Chemotaxis protein CheW n=1 Tax=Alteromonas arenosi TaxID=3055817 RepID=A0ABT7T0D4_9ALTE|nr:chemotaxis protein CheW [Alteromonas sp. ASW11-36]MDM7861895.1 chemotaxis protein CheW [Alteromonas sp. ASW11-36]